MTWLEAIADAMQTARQAGRFIVWMAALAFGIWLGWALVRGMVGQ